MFTINSHGVQISIARGVEEIIRDPNSTASTTFFFNHILIFVSS